MKQIFKRVTCICLVALMLSTLSVNAFATSGTVTTPPEDLYSLFGWYIEEKQSDAGVTHGYWLDTTTSTKTFASFSSQIDLILTQLQNNKTIIETSNDEEKILTAYIDYLIGLCWLDFNILSPIDGSGDNDASGNKFIGAFGYATSDTIAPFADYTGYIDRATSALNEFNNVCNTIREKSWPDTTDYEKGTYNIAEILKKDNTLSAIDKTVLPRRDIYNIVREILNSYVRNGISVTLASLIPNLEQKLSDKGWTLNPDNVLSLLEEGLRDGTLSISGSSSTPDDTNTTITEEITNENTYIVGDMPAFDIALNRWPTYSGLFKSEGDDVEVPNVVITGAEQGRDITIKNQKGDQKELIWIGPKAYPNAIGAFIPASTKAPGVLGFTNTIKRDASGGDYLPSATSFTFMDMNNILNTYYNDSKIKVNNYFLMYGNEQFLRYFSKKIRDDIDAAQSKEEAEKAYTKDIAAFAEGLGDLMEAFASQHAISSVVNGVEIAESRQQNVYLCNLLPGLIDETDFDKDGDSQIDTYLDTADSALGEGSSEFTLHYTGKITKKFESDSEESAPLFTKTHAEAVDDVNNELAKKLNDIAKNNKYVHIVNMVDVSVSNGAHVETASTLLATDGRYLNDTMRNKPDKKYSREDKDLANVKVAIDFGSDANNGLTFAYCHMYSLNEKGTEAIISMLQINKKLDFDLNGSTNGFKNADLTALANDKRLLPMLRTLSNAKAYYGQLFGVAYESVKASNGTEWRGYQFYSQDFYDMFDMGDLVDALYDVTYGEHSDMANGKLQTGAANDFGSGTSGDLNRSVLEVIANAKLDQGNIVWDNDEHAMTELGYIFLCAGVCYDPFNSIAGNETYLNLVLDKFKGQNGSGENEEKVKALLQEAIQKKKPLYVTEGSKSSWVNEEDLFEIPVANYRIAFLEDVFQEKSSTVKAYAVVSGEMNPSAVDSSTWEYKSGGAETSTTGSSTDATGATADTPTIQNNSSSAAQGSNVVAGTQLTAAGAEMSRPVLLTAGAKEGWMKGNWGAMQEGYAANVGGLTEIILHNARQDSKNNKHLQSAESEMLFLNGLGDIVLSDNTIVLPAIANPIIYEYDGIQYDTYNSAIRFYTPETDYQSVSVLGGSGSGNPIVQGPNDSLFTTEDEASTIYDDVKGYYPYTAAFMNHYPSAIINMEGDLALSNKNDEGKYVITINTRGAVLARRIQSVSNRSVATLYYRGGGVTVPNIQALSFCVADNIDYLGNVIPFRSGSDKGDNWTNAAESTMYMTKDTPFNSNEQPFFPLIEPDAEQMEDFIMLASPLMTSAYRFLTGRTVETANKARETFNMEHYVEMCGEGLLGTQYADTLIKNYKVSYDDMVDDTQGRFTRWLTQLTTSTVDTIGKIDGVLAIKNGYENTFFNLIVQFIQEFYLLIVIVLLIIVAIKFLRGHYNLIYVCFIGLLCLCGFEVYANWMPTIVPGAYNFAVNDAVEQIAWNTVAYNAESYTETYKDSDRKDATTGALKPYTATITLYKMSQDDMETVAARIGTTYESIKKGEVYYLDEAAGVFVQGDCIKMSVDKLLVNNSIRGMYYSQWKAQGTDITGSPEFIQPAVATYTDNPYLLELEEPYVSLEAYYIPFNEFERAFLANLNTFTQFFRLERNQFSYDRGLYKDAFVFNCFTNSGIFTAPGDRRVLLQNLAVGTLDTSRIQDTDMFLDEIEEYFMPEADWLNLDMVFEHPSVNMQDSLWGKTLQDRGWYDADWNITVNGRKELGELIGYINNMTKQFIIDNLDQLNFCSDENAIKLTTLYATTCFTHYVSEFGNWLYPNYLNAADMELKDVMYGSMTTLRDRNFAYDGTVVNTVALNLGFFGVLFIFFITIFATVFVFVMTYLVPILYAMFGAIIVLKLVLSKDGFGMVQGYIKVTLVTAILYFIFSLSLRLVEVGGYAWYGYLGCALIIFLCDYMMFWVCLSVVQNAGEMGNDVLGRNLLHGLDKLTHGAVSKLGVDRMFANRQSAKYGNGGAMPVPYQYGRHYNVDHYDPSRSSRRGLFGRGRSRTEDAYSAYGHGMSYDEAASYRDSDSHMPNFLRRATPEERAARREERRVQHETNRRRSRAARNVEYGDYDNQDL